MTRKSNEPVTLHSSAIFLRQLSDARRSTLLEHIMQAIGSLATMAQIVVASSHAPSSWRTSSNTTQTTVWLDMPEPSTLSPD